MSKFTKFLDQPASVTADVVTSTLVGAASIVVLKALFGIVPFVSSFTDILAFPGGGVIAAMTYLRARKNLVSAPPAAFKG